MKNTLIGAALLTAVSLPASAGMLGMDWETTGEYNLDTEVSTLTAQVGKTISLGSVSMTVDADFDIIGTAFAGTDYKAEMDVPGASGLEVYIKSGLNKSWERENVIAGVTFSW
tara:strand:+ start:71 stop:409 length:339 start_codon:yes stop_codon:yes gene_type:complete